MPTFRPISDPGRLWGTKVANLDQLMASPRRMAPDILRLFLANRTPITLWGPVGARKTRTIEAMAREVDENGVPYQVISIQPSTEDPTVIHGMMYTSQDTDGSTIMHRSIPDVAKQVMEYWTEHNGLTILFLDEMTTCMPAQQHALLGILTHGRYGDIDISPYISIAMAANPEGTVSTVNALGEQVLNRGGHIAWFGDVSLFLEEWSNGFGTPEYVPEPQTAWYVSELLMQAPDEAFRNPSNWSVEGLVPYDLMEHTERSITETGRMITLIQEVFSSSPDAIRHAYIVECTRALLGNEWASRMATVTAMEKSRMSPEAVVQQVREWKVGWDTTEEDLRAFKVDSLYLNSAGAPLRQDQKNVMMDGLLDLIYENDIFSTDAFISAWLFAVAAEWSGQTMSFHSQMIDLLKLGKQGQDQGALPNGSSVVPVFVGPDIKNTLRSMLKKK